MVLPFGSFGMYGSFSGGNVPQQMKAKYGNGYVDYGHQPVAMAYPFEVVPKHCEKNNHENKFLKFLLQCLR